MLELIRRLKANGFKELMARTGDDSFYLPSQKMYESCGFVEIRRNATSNDLRYGSIDYQLIF